MLREFSAAVFLAISTPTLAVPTSAKEPAWLVGFWHKTADEDSMPSDVMEFRADGSYINYGYHCVASPPLKFHIYDGDVYLRAHFPKGPVAILFHPSDDKKSLTFTSPRTRNNANYERLPADPCAGK